MLIRVAIVYTMEFERLTVLTAFCSTARRCVIRILLSDNAALSPSGERQPLSRSRPSPSRRIKLMSPPSLSLHSSAFPHLACHIYHQSAHKTSYRYPACDFQHLLPTLPAHFKMHETRPDLVQDTGLFAVGPGWSHVFEQGSVDVSGAPIFNGTQ